MSNFGFSIGSQTSKNYSNLLHDAFVTGRKHMEPVEEYSVRDLTPETWKDFEQFFAKYNGVQAGCWCMYYHRVHVTPGSTFEEKAENNRVDHKGLVEGRRAHGLMIYNGENVIGWAQFGPRDELPRVENGRVYKTLDKIPEETPLWRITCFFVDREYRRRGVASIALREVLNRIKESGGGVVESYPVTHSKAFSVWFGTVSMYEKHGFKKVIELGRSNVLMRKTIQ